LFSSFLNQGEKRESRSAYWQSGRTSTVAHSITVHTGEYAGTYAINAEDWVEYDAWISFIWSNASVKFEGGFYPDLTRPWRSGGLVFYHYDTQSIPQITDIYKLWKESESGGNTMATPYHLHPNQIGAPVLLTAANGTAVWAAEYAPFGQATVNDDVDGDGNKVTCNLRFPEQYFDAESGLHYNWHRYYEPKSGRYITLDPLGIGGGDDYTYLLLLPFSTNHTVNLRLICLGFIYHCLLHLWCFMYNWFHFCSIDRKGGELIEAQDTIQHIWNNR